MKMEQKLAAALAALLLISNSLPSFAKTTQTPKEPTAASDNAMIFDNTCRHMLIVTADDADTTASGPQDIPTTTADNEDITASGFQNTPIITADNADTTAPGEAPGFSARITLSPQGYIAEGTFKEFPPDISLVEPLYSLDGKNWQSCKRNWYLLLPEDMDNEITVKKLQNQTCLHENQEPLKSYIAKEIDCFYLKLRLTRENGITYDSQTAVIKREGPKPLSEEYTPVAAFSPSMLVRKFRPYICYGRYQITVGEHSTSEKIAAYLPDVLPIEIQILQENNAFARCTVDCPVTWKPLSLPELTAGESITIYDAAEEIIVPIGTILDTPAGVFQLEQPLSIHEFALSDEVRLVLNVIAENEEPTGALLQSNTGLETVFHLKPTGASAIRAYALAEGETEWTELSDVSLLETINAQPSTSNSKHALVLEKDQEPYRSYLEAEAAGEEPVPFFIGLKIEGGSYDGRQMILPWPNSYHIPVQLPALGGSGGNEGNAGSDNKNDSTTEGQRPNLPQEPEDNTGGQQPNPPSGTKDDAGGQQPNPPLNTEDNPNGSQTDPPQDPENNSGGTQTNPSPDSGNNSDGAQTNPPQNSGNNSGGTQTNPSLDSEKNPNGSLTDSSQNSVNNANSSPIDSSQNSGNNTGRPQTNSSQNSENNAGRPQTDSPQNKMGRQQAHTSKTPGDSIKTPDMLGRLFREILNEEQQSPERNYIPESSEDSIQPFIRIPAETDIHSDKKHPPILASGTAKPPIQAEDPASDTVDMETKTSHSFALSEQEEQESLTEQPDRSRETSYHRIFLLIAAAALAGVCAAPAVSKKTVRK